MTIGGVMIIGGLVFAFWQSTKFSVYGMFAGYGIAAIGTVLFLDNFVQWWLA